MSEGSSDASASGDPGPERPDPSRIASPTDFGKELTRAREHAGLAVRDLAAQAKVPAGTVSGYLTGAHLPQPTYLDPFRRVLAVLGEGEPERLRQWEEALLRVRRTPGKRSASTPSPYPGLRSFQPQDAALFHGRGEVTGEIVRRAGERAAGGGGPLMVVGASGSGKSSLLRAGVIPALAALGFETALTVPGARALAQLEAWAEDPPDGVSRALVIDQFEDTFARGPVELPEQRLVDGLANLGERTVAVLGMRADFYLNALLHPPLAAALQHDQVILRPMTPAELRHAIVDPARQLGYDVEPSLVELILRDLNPRTRGGHESAAHDAGALPFLSHALHSTWERSRGRRLTVDDYLSAGGVERSIANAADSVFAELTEPQQDSARRLLLRLVRTGDGVADTRRRPRITETVEYGGECEVDDTRRVLEAFVAARLLTINNDRVEITHDALLRAWPRLSGWIDTYRDWLRLHHRITEAANAWDLSGRDPDSLYRGGQLQVAVDAIEGGGYAGELNKLETDFYEASRKAHRAREIRERRRIRRRYRFIALLAVLAVIAAGSVVFAVQVRGENSRDQAQALSRSVASESNQLRGIEVSLSMQLALTAYRIWPTPEARAALLASTDVQPGTRVLIPGDQLTAMTVGGPGDTVLATGTLSGPVQLWTAASTTHITRSTSLPGPTGDVQALAVSSSGTLVAAGDSGGRIHLWGIANRAHPQSLPTLTAPGTANGASAINGLTLSPNGQILAAATSAGQILLWDIADPAHPAPIPTQIRLPGKAATLAFSANGSILACASGTTVQLWNTTAPTAPVQLGAVSTDPSAVLSVAISPDGQTLAAGLGEAHSTMLWDIADPAHPRPEPSLTGPTGHVNSIAFSPDSKRLAAGSSDGQAWVYDLSTGQAIAQLPHPRPVGQVAYRSDGTLLTCATDGTVRSWAPTGPLITSPKDTIFALDFTADGTRMVIGGGANDDTETLWNVTDFQHPQQLGPPLANALSSTVYSGSGAITPNGRTVAIGDNDGTVQLWNTADPQHPVFLRPAVQAADTTVESVTISNHGAILAVANDDGTVPLYDIANPADPIRLAVIPAQGSVGDTYEAVFSPDDHLLAVASGNHHAYLWNIADPRHPVLLAKLPSSTVVFSASFLGSDDYLAVGSESSTQIWNITDPARPTAAGAPLTGPIGYIYDLAYDPRHHLLADPGSTDGSIYLWDVTNPNSPTLVADLPGPPGGVLAAAFSPNGDTLAAGGNNHTVHLWNTDIPSTEQWICSVAGQDLTPQEWTQYVPGTAYNPPCPADDNA